MALDKTTAAELEQAASEQRSGVDLAREQQKRAADRVMRILVVDKTIALVNAPGFTCDDVMVLMRDLHTFLIENTDA